MSSQDKEIVAAYGIAIFEKQGYEADDIIATMVKKAKDKGLSTTIVSSDKDILQLVDEETVVFSPYKDEGALYDERKVFQRYGVNPKQIPDIIALMGDSADNIPNVPGIGEGYAVELIKEFGSLDALLENIDRIKQDKLKSTIKNNINTAKLNKELVLLNEAVDIDFELDKLKIGQPDFKKLFKLFKHLEFKKFLQDLPLSEDKSKDVKVTRIEDKELKIKLSERDELVLYGTKIDSLTFHAQGKFFYLSRLGRNLKEVLSNPGIKKVGHGLKIIKMFLAKEGISLEGLHFDTMLAAYLINPSRSEYNLLGIAWDYLEEAASVKSIDEARAVDFIVRLKPKLEKELNDKSLLSLFFDIEMPLIEVLAEMELSGIKLDLKVLQHLSKDLEKKLIKLIEDIYDISGTQFNINSPKQLRGILFEKLKLPVIKKSKTGPSTDEEVLRKLSDKHKLPALLLEYRQLMKLKTTYIDVLPTLVDEKTGKIHTSFNQAATETGRLSSSNPNLQNIPIKTDIGKNIRKAIIASGREDYLLSCDYSQIELRILAHLSGDENLITAFINDKDIHKATAALIYNLPEKDITDSMREMAKRINFGIIYGLSAWGLSRDLRISADEAQSFIDAYFTRYPKVKDYIEKQIKRAQKEGFVTTIMGRRRYLPEINNKNQAIRQLAERQAVNTPIQGSASDLIKLAMIHIHKQIKQKNMKTKMILQIHDELVFETPEKELEEVARLIKDSMENVLKLDVPIKVDIKKGENWLEMEEFR